MRFVTNNCSVAWFALYSHKKSELRDLARGSTALDGARAIVITEMKEVHVTLDGD
jgi:hypothetical protein